MVVTADSSHMNISEKPKYDNKKETHAKDVKRERLTLKKLKDKKYPFPNFDLSGKLDSLLEQKVF